MKIIKIIDLLIMIANDEELPKTINYLNNLFIYNIARKDYYNEYYGYLFSSVHLNDEVEIMETFDNTEKIKKLDENDVHFKVDYQNWNNDYQIAELIDNFNNHEIAIKSCIKKINEIIDYINEVKDV